MITYFAQALPILTLFWLMYELALKRITFFTSNRFFLLMGLFCSALFPLIPLNLAEQEIQYIRVDPNSISLLNGNEPLVETTWSLLDYMPETFTEALIALYVLGLIFFLARLGVQLFTLIGILKTGKWLNEDGIKVVYTERDLAPFSFFNTIVINPQILSAEQWEDVMTHEKIHIQQGHQLDVVVTELLRCVFWFYPIFHLYASRVKLNLEYLTDSQALENGLDRKKYQLSLVGISQQKSSPRLVNHFSKRILKNRIQMIHKMKSNNKLKYAYAGLMPAMLCAIFFLSTTVQSQEKRIKKVIVLTQEQTAPNDVRVEVRDENGQLQQVPTEQIEVINPDDSQKTVTIEEIEEKDDATGKTSTRTVTRKKYTVGNNENGRQGNILAFRIDKDMIGPKKIGSIRIDTISFDYQGDDDLPESILNNLTPNEKEKIFVRSIKVAPSASKNLVTDAEKSQLSKRELRQLEKIEKKVLAERAKNKVKPKVEGYFYIENDGYENVIKDKTHALSDNDPDNDPVIYIDGEIADKAKMDKMSPESIATISVLKGKSSKHPNGEIRVTTKNQDKKE